MRVRAQTVAISRVATGFLKGAGGGHCRISYTVINIIIHISNATHDTVNFVFCPQFIVIFSEHHSRRSPVSHLSWQQLIKQFGDSPLESAR